MTFALRDAARIGYSAPMETDSAPAAPSTPAPRTVCLNCGAELQGEHCHACGQPVKGMIRPLSSMLHDVADTIFNIDSRIFHTLVPLYFRPGYLSNEYFAGRRVRYVTPFRLYFFLSVAAFLLMQWSLSGLFGDPNPIHFDTGTDTSIHTARTSQEVIARRDKALAELNEAKSKPFVPAAEIDKAADSVRKQADQRLAELKAAPAPAPGSTIAKESDRENPDKNDWGWNPRTDPIHVRWLPASANAKLTSIAEHMLANTSRIRKNPRPFMLAAFGMLPQVLFVLMPLFALLLKIFYLFKRRLYMEHLIVALHSHAFIFQSLLLLTLADMARTWAQDAAPWLHAPLGVVIFAMSWWLPIYLLLMQKKVYKQGWFFTSLKYCVIGICYTVLISLGVAAAFAISLATT